MFKFSFNQISEDQDLGEGEKENFPLIAALNFAKINSSESNTEKIQIPPIYCSECGSILSNKENLQQMDDGFQFECEFCLKINKLSQIEGEKYLGIISNQMNATDLSFLLEQIRVATNKTDLIQEIKPSAGINIQIAVIDISGSMEGGKLEAVKQALVQNIHEITAESPNTKFGLIPFSTNVLIYPNPEKGIMLKDGPLFFQEEKLTQKIEKIIEQHRLGPMEKSYEKWTTIVKQLQSFNMTALGPALFVGIQLIIASQKSELNKKGGKVILLTDGLANVGMGSVTNTSLIHNEGKSVVFYHSIAENCIQNNIIVDIVAVRDQDGSNSVALDTIGKITDYTGGNMVFITADQIESAFGDLHHTNYIARNVELRVFAPDFLSLEEIQGVDLLQAIPEKNGQPIKLGAFSADREIYLKFKEPRKIKSNRKDIPIQIQVSYLDSNNNKQVRLYNQIVPLSKNRETFRESFDPKVATAYELAKASRLKAKGEYQQAQIQAQATQERNKMWANQAQQKGNIGSIAYSQELNELVEDEMDEWKIEEQEASIISDKSSFYAAKGQSRYRASYDSKLERMKKKKK